MPWPFLKSIALSSVTVVEPPTVTALALCLLPEAPKAVTSYQGAPLLKRCGDNHVLSAPRAALLALAVVPSNVKLSRVQAFAPDAIGFPATLDGNAKVRPPVPSWQMSSSKSC